MPYSVLETIGERACDQNLNSPIVSVLHSTNPFLTTEQRTIFPRTQHHSLRISIVDTEFLPSDQTFYHWKQIFVDGRT